MECDQISSPYLVITIDRINNCFAYENRFASIYHYNLVIELVTRTDLERNKFADVVSSFKAVAGICVDDALEFADRLLIMMG